MKIQALLLGAVIATLAASSFATEALLSPRAAGNQLKTVPTVAEAPALTVASLDSKALLTPRAAGNQIKSVQGTITDVNPAAICRETMPGTPRAVTECSSHANMPGCAPVIARK